jgi:hypothetical protein
MAAETTRYGNEYEPEAQPGDDPNARWFCMGIFPKIISKSCKNLAGAFFSKLQFTSPISACIAHYAKNSAEVNEAAQAVRR